MNLRKFLRLMNNAVFGKAIENVRKHRDIKLVSSKTRRNYLVSGEIITLQSFSQDIYLQ